jgi:hypothetical protein
VDLRNIGAFQKIRRIWKILALFRKSGGFEKLALFRKSGGFTKYWCLAEKQADLRNIGAWQRKQADDRILAGVEISAPVE